MMLPVLTEVLTPLAVDLVLIVAGIAATWAIAKLPPTLRLRAEAARRQIEEIHRDALQAALTRHLEAMLGAGRSEDEMVVNAQRYLERHVPDAVAALRPSTDYIRTALGQVRRWQASG